MADKLDSIGHYKVGYVCGVYDMFHIGHLNLLRRCKEHCDYLIVGVNSDELTEFTKNKTPVINENERMAIVGAIRYVDDVVLVDFHNETTSLAYSLYNFDVQFCGDDHEEALLPTRDWLRSQGSDMVFFPYTTSTSSTMLREKLKEGNNG